MKKFAFSMEKILELRRFEQSQAELELGKVNAEIAKNQNQLKEIAAKRVSITKSFNTNADILVLSQIQNFFYFLDQKKEKCMEEIARLELIADEKREIVRKAMQNVKVLEKLRESKYLAWKKEMLKDEELASDDVVTSQFQH